VRSNVLAGPEFKVHIESCLSAIKSHVARLFVLLRKCRILKHVHYDEFIYLKKGINIFFFLTVFKSFDHEVSYLKLKRDRLISELKLWMNVGHRTNCPSRKNKTKSGVSGKKNPQLMMVNEATHFHLINPTQRDKMCP